jgi:hypothetical protein
VCVTIRYGRNAGFPAPPLSRQILNRKELVMNNIDPLALTEKTINQIRKGAFLTVKAGDKLRKIMDFLITDYGETPHDLSEACPAFKQKDVGRKTYAALIKCLSEQDLGCAFGIEWNKRLHKFMCCMRKRWGHIPDSFRQYEV